MENMQLSLGDCPTTRAVAIFLSLSFEASARRSFRRQAHDIAIQVSEFGHISQDHSPSCVGVRWRVLSAFGRQPHDGPQLPLAIWQPKNDHSHIRPVLNRGQHVGADERPDLPWVRLVRPQIAKVAN